MPRCDPQAPDPDPEDTGMETAQPKREKMTCAARSVEAFTAWQRARIVGLVRPTEHNGAEVEVISFCHDLYRYVASMQDGPQILNPKSLRLVQMFVHVLMMFILYHVSNVR